MALQVGDGLGLHVAGQAQLHRDAAIVHPGHQVGILDQVRAVPDAVGPAVVQRLVDRGRPEGLARMDRDVDVVVQDVQAGLDVVLGRIVLLGARQVEADHAAPLPANGQFGQLEARSRRNVADAADDLTADDAVLAPRQIQTFLHRTDDLVVHQTFVEVQQRRVAHFHVAHVLAMRVLGQFVGDARQRLACLHQLQRDVEDAQVLHQARAILGHLAHRAHVLSSVLNA